MHLAHLMETIVAYSVTALEHKKGTVRLVVLHAHRALCVTHRLGEPHVLASHKHEIRLYLSKTLDSTSLWVRQSLGSRRFAQQIRVLGEPLCGHVKNNVPVRALARDRQHALDDGSAPPGRTLLELLRERVACKREHFFQVDGFPHKLRDRVKSRIASRGSAPHIDTVV
jgi:hypothetical protein